METSPFFLFSLSSALFLCHSFSACLSVSIFLHFFPITLPPSLIISPYLFPTHFLFTVFFILFHCSLHLPPLIPPYPFLIAWRVNAQISLAMPCATPYSALKGSSSQGITILLCPHHLSPPPQTTPLSPL